MMKAAKADAQHGLVRPGEDSLCNRGTRPVLIGNDDQIGQNHRDRAQDLSDATETEAENLRDARCRQFADPRRQVGQQEHADNSGYGEKEAGDAGIVGELAVSEK